MDDDQKTRRTARTSLSPLAWAVAIAGPVVVSAALIPLWTETRTSNVPLVLVLATEIQN